MPINIRDRYTGGTINIDGRTETIDGTPPIDDEYSLTLVIAPVLINPGQGASVTVRARKNGLPIAQLVTFSSDAPSVAPVPDDVTTGANGNASFAIVGGIAGDAFIGASMVVDGNTITATAVELVVTDFDVPVDLDATGQGIIELTLEPRLVESLYPKVERLSHQNQLKNYPGDMGLKWLTFYETADIVWMPKELQ